MITFGPTTVGTGTTTSHTVVDRQYQTDCLVKG